MDEYMGNRVLADILRERRRHIDVKGFTSEHDDEHKHGEMARAAACYALADDHRAHRFLTESEMRALWPWNAEWWKPRGKRRNLIRAAALIVAEIERLDRKVEHGQRN